MDLTLFTLLLIVGGGLGLPTDNAPGKQRSYTRVLQHDEVHDEFGQYALRYITEDGTVVSERGLLKPNAQGTGYVLTKEGSINYLAPDGSPVYMEYVADENGFRPIGSHIPVAPSSINHTDDENAEYPVDV